MTVPRTVEFDVTREDWIAVNVWHMANSAAWQQSAGASRRKQLIQLAWAAPLIIAGASLGVGRAAATSGMYVEGALCGLGFVALVGLGLWRIDVTTGPKKQRIDELRRADLSDYVGRMCLRFDERGVAIESTRVQTRVDWCAARVYDAGDFVMIDHASGGNIVPKRAFATLDEAAQFLAELQQLCVNGQVPEPERIGRYVADRDVQCPECSYNLRGVKGATCPECGLVLSMEQLVRAPQ